MAPPAPPLEKMSDKIAKKVAKVAGEETMEDLQSGSREAKAAVKTILAMIVDRAVNQAVRKGDIPKPDAPELKRDLAKVVIKTASKGDLLEQIKAGKALRKSASPEAASKAAAPKPPATDMMSQMRAAMAKHLASRRQAVASDDDD